MTSAAVTQGDSAILRCVVSSFPPSNITWRRNGKELQGSQYQFNTASYSVKILNVKFADAGNYECNVVNTFGEAIANATLNVGCKILN